MINGDAAGWEAAVADLTLPATDPINITIWLHLEKTKQSKNVFLVQLIEQTSFLLH